GANVTLVTDNSHNGLLRNSGTLRITGGVTELIDFENAGTIELVAGELRPSRKTAISFGETGYLWSRPESTLVVRGDFHTTTRSAQAFNASGRLLIDGTAGSDAPQHFEVAGNDFGPLSAGFHENFAHGTLELRSTYLVLRDEVDSANGEGSEVFYVDTLVIDAGSTLDLNGLRVYARNARIEGTVLGGSVELVASGGQLALDLPTSGT